MTKLRAAVIGLGRIGHSFGTRADGDPLSHVAAWAAVPEVDIVLGVDPLADRRDAFARDFPRAQVRARSDDAPLIDIDVASVCSPTSHHLADVRTAIAWGARAILCEKPLAASVVEAEQLVAACREARVALLTNYSRRWAPCLSAITELVRTRGFVATGASLRYSGGLVHNGSHWIDLLQALFGAPVDTRRLERGSRDPSDVDPAESIALTFRDGLTAFLLSVRGTNASIGEGEIWGDGALVRLLDGGRRVVVERTTPSEYPGFAVLGAAEEIVADGLRGALLAAVRETFAFAARPEAERAQQAEHGELTCSGDDGLLALRTIDAARRGSP